MNEKIVVLARHYSKDEEFWLGYKCRKCGLRFASITELQTHSKNHQNPKPSVFIYKRKTIDTGKAIKTGICSQCGKAGITHLHHNNYHDEDPLKDTQELCSSCHGKWHAKNTPNWGKINRNISTPD